MDTALLINLILCVEKKSDRQLQCVTRSCRMPTKGYLYLRFSNHQPVKAICILHVTYNFKNHTFKFSFLIWVQEMDLPVVLIADFFVNQVGLFIVVCLNYFIIVINHSFLPFWFHVWWIMSRKCRLVVSSIRKTIHICVAVVLYNTSQI